MLQTAQRPPVFDPDGVGLCLMSTAPPGQRFHGSSLDNMTGVSYPVPREHDMSVMLCVRFQCSDDVAKGDQRADAYVLQPTG